MASAATIGSSNDYARADHVHPAQTTVSGNAGTATRLSSDRAFSLTGDVTGSASSNLTSGVTIDTTLQGFDASKIISGTIAVERLPLGSILPTQRQFKSALKADTAMTNGGVVEAGCIYNLTAVPSLGVVNTSGFDMQNSSAIIMSPSKMQFSNASFRKLQNLDDLEDDADCYVYVVQAIPTNSSGNYIYAVTGAAYVS